MGNTKISARIIPSSQILANLYTTGGISHVPYKWAYNYSNFVSAIDDIGANEATLVISQEESVSINKTVPSNVTLFFTQGGSLNIASGKTVTINGDVQAGLYQIFKGSGNVILNGVSQGKNGISSEWFAGTDIGARVNNAHDALPAGGGKILLPATDGKLEFSTAISFTKSVILQGMGRSDTTNFNGTCLRFTKTDGTDALSTSANNSKFQDFRLSEKSGAGNAIVLKNGTNNITQCVLENLIVMSGDTGTYAIVINRPINCAVRDVHVRQGGINFDNSGGDGTSSGAYNVWVANANIGIRIWSQVGLNVIGGAVEGCDTGIETGYCTATIQGVDLEGNNNIDIDLGKNAEVFIVGNNLSSNVTDSNIKTTDTHPYSCFIAGNAFSGTPVNYKIDLSSGGQTFTILNQKSLSASDINLAASHNYNTVYPCGNLYFSGTGSQRSNPKEGMLLWSNPKLSIYDGSNWQNILPHFEHRGDPTSYDFTLADLTTDENWHDLDLSSIVPSGAKCVALWVQIVDDAVGKMIRFRKNGNTNTYNIVQVRTQAVDAWIDGNLSVACDNNQIIEYWASNVTWTNIYIVVHGWWF